MTPLAIHVGPCGFYLLLLFAAITDLVTLTRMKEPLCFDELRVGDRWTSPARTITETDIVNFACMTGDFDPLHVDHEFARRSMYRRPIAHGLLGLSFLAGLSSRSPVMCNFAFVGIRDWRFLKPLHVGDTVSVVTVVEELQRQGRRSGRVLWRRQLINQDGVVTQEGVLETLVATRTNTMCDDADGGSIPSPHVSADSDLEATNQSSAASKRLR